MRQRVVCAVAGKIEIVATSTSPARCNNWLDIWIVITYRKSWLTIMVSKAHIDLGCELFTGVWLPRFADLTRIWRVPL
jgi:hypothetical protein